jgi:hypothetical protein
MLAVPNAGRLGTAVALGLDSSNRLDGSTSTPSASRRTITQAVQADA